MSRHKQTNTIEHCEIPTSRSIIRVLCAVALLCASILPSFLSAAIAAPTPPAQPVSLSNIPAAVTTGDGLTFAISYTLPEASSWTSIEMRLKNKDGKAVVYQEGWVDAQPKGVQTFTATIPLSQEDLSSGQINASQVYSIEVVVRSKVASVTYVGEATGMIPIYVAGYAPAQLALIARVQTQILENPNGEFSRDPASDTKLADTVLNLINETQRNPAIRFTLAISPAMLEEWQHISQGYTIAAKNADEEGIVVSPDEETPKKYDLVLSSIRSAVESGHISLAVLPYSDPDFSTLTENDLGSDAAAQFTRGLATLQSVTTTQTAEGTVPYRLAPTPSVMPVLAENKLTWTVVDDTYASADDGQAVSGVWAIKGSDSVRALVNDSASTAAFADDDAGAVLSRMMERYANAEEPHTLVCSADVSTQTDQGDLLNLLRSLAAQPWMIFADANEVARNEASRGSIEISQAKALSLSEAFADSLKTSRAQADAVDAITETGEKTAALAMKNSLIAEAGIWAASDNSSDVENRGLAFAKNGEKEARSILDQISLQVEPITLSQSSGEVPLVVSNGTSEYLSVQIKVEPSTGLELGMDAVTLVSLRPQDNYLSIPVKIADNATGGDLRVSVIAGNQSIEEQDVTIKSSFMDRIFMLLAIALVLIGILIYIRRRVRTSEKGEGQKDQPVADVPEDTGDIEVPDDTPETSNTEQPTDDSENTTTDSKES